jgi:hypothetical protein
LFIGAGAVRLLIRLASKLPMHPAETAGRIKDGHQQMAPIERPVVGAERARMQSPKPG